MLFLTVVVGPASTVAGGGGGCSVFRVSALPGLLTLTVSVFTEAGAAVMKTLALGGGTGGD